jgi:hypothetical protein
MKYIPVDNEAFAMYISSLIYDLTRPSIASNDVTQYSLPWDFDINNVCYIVVDLNFILPIHVDRGPAIEAAIRDLQTQGKITQQSADTMIQVAASNSGSAVTVSQIIPSEWLDIAVDSIIK